MRAQLCDRGEFDKAKFVGQMRVDVIEHASYLPGRKPASVRDRRTLRGRKGRAPPPLLISSAAVEEFTQTDSPAEQRGFEPVVPREKRVARFDRSD